LTAPHRHRAHRALRRRRRHPRVTRTCVYVCVYIRARARTHARTARARSSPSSSSSSWNTNRQPHARHARPTTWIHAQWQPTARSHATPKQIARRASSDDSAHTERRSIALKNRTHAASSCPGHHHRSHRGHHVVRTCGTVILFTGERRTRSGACARECAHRTRRRTHATHGGCPPPRVDDVGARD